MAETAEDKLVALATAYRQRDPAAVEAAMKPILERPPDAAFCLLTLLDAAARP